MRIRPAEPADAGAIAQVHVRAWHETYRGIMPDSLLDKMTVEGSRKAWNERLPTLASNRQTIMVALNGAAEIVGFAGCGPTRVVGERRHLGADGEIYMINIVNKAKRQHAGAMLMQAMAGALEDGNFATAGLWVLEKNLPARAFYERLGGKPGIAIENEHDGFMLKDIAILWPRIATLRERAGEVLSADRPR